MTFSSRNPYVLDIYSEHNVKPSLSVCSQKSHIVEQTLSQSFYNFFQRMTSFHFIWWEKLTTLYR